MKRLVLIVSLIGIAGFASPLDLHAQGRGRGGGQQRPDPVIKSGEVRLGPGGSRYRGIKRPTGVNNDPNAQPD